MISIKTRTTPTNLAKYISGLPRELRGIASEASAIYLVGNGSHGLKKYPPYKYITRKRAFGRTFVSDRQRRFVMARIRSGKIDPGYPHRTGKFQRGWKIVRAGTKTQITNGIPYAPFVVGDTQQSRHEKLVGWMKIKQILKAESVQAMAAAAGAAIEKRIKQLGLA